MVLQFPTDEEEYDRLYIKSFDRQVKKTEAMFRMYGYNVHSNTPKQDSKNMSTDEIHEMFEKKFSRH